MRAYTPCKNTPQKGRTMKKTILLLMLCILTSCTYHVSAPLNKLDLKTTDLNTLIRLSERFNKPLYSKIENFFIMETGKERVSRAIIHYSLKHNVPVISSFSLSYIESRYKVTASRKNTNKSRDYGLYQLNNKSFPKYSRSQLIDIDINVNSGLAYFSYLLQKFDNPNLAVAAYNAGPNRVLQGRIPSSTFFHVCNFGVKADQIYVDLKLYLMEE